MKIISAAIFLAVLATVLIDCDAYLSEAAIQKTTKMLKSVCSKKGSKPVDDETLSKVKKGEFDDNDNDLQCYFACTLKTMQLATANGLLGKKDFKEKMKLLAPPTMLAVLMPAIEECTDKEETGTLCKAAFNFVKCAYGVDPKTLDYLPV